MKSNKLIAPLVGNTLEYYDFTLYGAFTPFIANYFFPPQYGASLTLLTYALSFLMRPVGAIVFGYIGDVRGRKKALGLPLILMAIFTLGIALLPSYKEIGATSSMLLILCRIGQGFCMGGEYGGAVVLSLEHQKQSNLWFTAGVIGSSVILGSLLANITSYIFTLPIFPDSFWRIPFYVGALIGLIGIWVRYRVEESPEFVFLHSSKAPLAIVIQQHLLSVIKAVLVNGLTGIFGAFSYVYINFYLVSKLNWELNKSLGLIIFGHIISIIVCSISGLAFKKYFPLRIISLCAISCMIIITPCLYLITTNHILATTFAMFIFAVITGVCWGSVNLSLFRLFPTSVRYTGIAFSESFGRILFVAPMPFLCNYFIDVTGSILAPAAVIMSLIFLILAGLYILSNRLRHKDNLVHALEQINNQ